MLRPAPAGKGSFGVPQQGWVEGQGGVCETLGLPLPVPPPLPSQMNEHTSPGEIKHPLLVFYPPLILLPGRMIFSGLMKCLTLPTRLSPVQSENVAPGRHLVQFASTR